MDSQGTDHASFALRAMLRRLREAMKQPPWAGDPERQGFLREGEELLQAEEPGPKM
jgi:hypothetical protein